MPELAVRSDVRDATLARAPVATGLLALVLGVLVYGPTLVWLWERWTLSVWHHAHGMLIPPVVAYFAWLELRGRTDLPANGSAWGFLFLVPALMLHALDAGLHTELLSAASLVVALPGVSLLLLGVERTRRIAFPLVFLVFMLPIPLGVVERLILLLREISTFGTAVLVPLAGIPLFAEGTTVHLARASLEVADACSGFSTLYAAVAVAFLTAYSSTIRWRRIVVLLIAAPLAVLANVVRVSILVLVVHWQGTDVLATRLHEISGLVTFALVLPIIFWLGGSEPTGPRP